MLILMLIQDGGVASPRSGQPASHFKGASWVPRGQYYDDDDDDDNCDEFGWLSRIWC